MSDIKALLALADENRIQEIKQSLGLIKRLKFHESHDGTDALFKLGNDAFQVLLIEENLPRRSGTSVCEWVLLQRNLSSLAMIIITNEQNHPSFSELTASGRVQFLKSDFSDSDLKLSFVKALNYVLGSGSQDYRVRFIISGEVLIREGESASSVFLVQSGRLKAYKDFSARQTVLGEIGPGEFVGEMAYINREMRSATVVADSDSELVEIPIQFVDRILFEKPSWAKALLRTLSKRLKLSNSRL